MKKSEMKKLHKPCIRCNERFLPSGRRSRVCDNCIKKIHTQWRKEVYEKEII